MKHSLEAISITILDILSNYHITPERLRACAVYVQARLGEERVFPPAV